MLHVLILFVVFYRKVSQQKYLSSVSNIHTSLTLNSTPVRNIKNRLNVYMIQTYQFVTLYKQCLSFFCLFFFLFSKFLFCIIWLLYMNMKLFLMSSCKEFSCVRFQIHMITTHKHTPLIVSSKSSSTLRIHTSVPNRNYS